MGPGAGLAFVKTCFPEAADALLIATAYFSVQGYELARAYLPAATCVHVLVGKRDGLMVQKAVIKEIERELRSVAPPSLYAAVEDILERLRTKRFRIADARGMEKPFHCKFYISHEALAWHGSANFSLNGLRGQAEQAEVVHDPVQIGRWRVWFFEVAEAARDLHEELVGILEAWLRMAEPFHVYLKALLCLLDVSKPRREREALTPVYYQQRLAAWAVRQVDAHGGALLVVATGLGKTVIGAEVAGLLRAADDIAYVLLLAPRATHKSWKAQLFGRGVPFDAFDNRVLFREAKGYGAQTYELVARLEKADARTLLLVDEAHIFRNQLLAHKSEKGSLVIKRILEATERGARVVLMTGSAYGTSVQNLDSLLYLLPHRNPEALYGHGPWEVLHKQFSELPPVVILGYPHVLAMARGRGDVEDGHPYVDFEFGRHYLPTMLQTRLIYYDLPLEAKVAEAFGAGCFSQERKVPTLCFSDEEGEMKKMTDTVYNVTLDSWLSSPRALRACIGENLATEGPEDPPGQIRLFPNEDKKSRANVQHDLWGKAAADKGRGTRRPVHATGYTAAFRLNHSSRRGHLEALLEELGPLQNRADEKAEHLVALLRQRREAGPVKVIIFVERHVTARYLKRVLNDRMSSLRVGCTVTRSGALETARRRADLLRRFSPRSHGQLGSDRPLDVLICTDADGIGVNLQDADTIVNYDLTAGADRLVQRLGRILRATPERGKTRHVYTLLPSLLERNANAPEGNVHERVYERYTRLFARHERSSELLGSRILTAAGDAEVVRLDGEVEVASLLESQVPLAKADGYSSLATHLGVLEGHRQQAENLPHALHSARHYNGVEPRLVVVLREGDRYHPLVVEPVSQRVVSESASTALDLLACQPDTPRAGPLSPSVSDVLGAANEAVRRWCRRRGKNIDDVERVAALYLLPKPTKV